MSETLISNQSVPPSKKREVSTSNDVTKIYTTYHEGRLSSQITGMSPDQQTLVQDLAKDLYPDFMKKYFPENESNDNTSTVVGLGQEALGGVTIATSLTHALGSNSLGISLGESSQFLNAQT